MVWNEAKKVHAAFDNVDATLDRVAALPLHELTLEDSLTLRAQLEMLRLALAKVAHGVRSAVS